MNVFSTFDGIACGYVALNLAGIKVDNYIASEIDNDAIKVAITNFPNIVEIGDIRGVDSVSNIDLLIGGSPCQSLSLLGDGSRFDGKSGIFYEFVRLKNEINPRWFLFENVGMRKADEFEISKQLGVWPIKINSNLVMPQSRPRLYWTNIDVKFMPPRRNVRLCDLLGADDDNYVQSEKWHKWFGRKSDDAIRRGMIRVDPSVACCLTARMYKNYYGNFITTPKGIRRLSEIECERLQGLPDNYTSGVDMWKRYQLLGNSWTVNVISHIFSYME